MNTYIIPGLPIPQARMKNAGKWVYEPKRSKEYKEYVRDIFRSYKPKIIESGPISVSIIFKLPLSKYNEGDWHFCRPDIDNLEKIVLDAGNEILWTDDCQVCDVWKTKSRGKEPHTEIVVVAL